ncbi:hypothetical protein [Pseudosulfitobacter sp. DSM 107133]|uniref:hypothetical protein n=1 Tax=Pseudosulfitobacter sp. DSM 107133 TaxID=2883100 RepID=UPI0013B38CF9|nr:hypothetical protein [Pseudosulfitobacter sp. DSM 107133]UOA27883.1 hypothetical protein DSM107133_02622 [Pseudosulfitobacter sp. DSM 107133]
MINFATIAGELLPFRHGNVNQTFKALVATSDGRVPVAAIIKDLPVKELFNELISFLILKDLGLPVPDTYLGLVPAGNRQISKGPLLPDGARLVLASKDVGSPNLKFVTNLSDLSSEAEAKACLSRFVPELAKWGKFGEMYAFDTWVANVDRNLGNVLFGGTKPDGSVDVWVIDHGQALTSEMWQPNDLIPEGSYMNKLQIWAVPFLTDDNKSTCLGSLQLFEIKAHALDKRSKVEYLSKMFGLDDASKNAVTNFLELRLAEVSGQCRTALMVETMI